MATSNEPARPPLLPWVAEILKPYLGGLVIAAVLAGVISACRAALVFLTRDLLDQVLSSQRHDLLWLLPLALVGLFGLQATARIGRTWLTRRASLFAERSLRAKLFDHLLSSQPARLREEGLGDMLSRLTHDAGKIRTAVGAAVTVLQRPLTAVAVAVAAITMAPKLALWAAVGLPLVVGVILVTGRLTRRASREQHSKLGDLTSEARDVLDGLRTIQAYGAEERSRQNFDRVNRSEIRAGLRTSMFRLGGPPAVEFAAALGVACVLGVGAQQVQGGHLTTGELVAFLLALGLLSEPLKGISVASGLWEEAKGGLERVQEALLRPVGSTSLSAKETRRPALPLHLEIRNLKLRFGDQEVLRGIDLHLRPGDRVVIRGESGSGKSSLLDCIAGFTEPTSGLMLWAGEPAETYPLSSRRQLLSLVDQRPWLGRGSVGDAIRIGRAGATQRDVEEAAEAAGLQLPLERLIGDGGLAVSGGERQRIALARALLRSSPLLILDEPCSNLDLESEQRFLQQLVAASGEMAVLLVTHKPAALAFATQVYELREGRLTPAAMLQALA